MEHTGAGRLVRQDAGGVLRQVGAVTVPPGWRDDPAAGDGRLDGGDPVTLDRNRPARRAARASVAAGVAAVVGEPEGVQGGYFVAPEYSSIWAFRSIGYEMVTSEIRPSGPVTAVSLG